MLKDLAALSGRDGKIGCTELHFTDSLADEKDFIYYLNIVFSMRYCTLTNVFGINLLYLLCEVLKCIL